jgi:hypothetical protein
MEDGCDGKVLRCGAGDSHQQKYVICNIIIIRCLHSVIAR